MSDNAPPAAMPPRIRDEHKLPKLPDREWRRMWGSKGKFWRDKQAQADALLDAIPLRRVFEERIALCDVTPGINGGVWL